MSTPDIFQALEPVIQAFEMLGIDYQIGGSIASSAYGIARATLDVDLVADLREQHIRPFVEHLSAAYYMDEDRVRDAVARQSSFNLIHLESMFKVDVFVLKSASMTRSHSPGHAWSIWEKVSQTDCITSHRPRM